MTINVVTDVAEQDEAASLYKTTSTDVFTELLQRIELKEGLPSPRSDLYQRKIMSIENILRALFN